MVATALGLFGGGPLSRRQVGAIGAPLRVEYDRVARFGASVRLVVHARPSNGDVRMRLSRSLLTGFRVQDVTPNPAATTVVDDGVEYRFRTATDRAAEVIFEVQPAVRWSIAGDIEAPLGAVRIRQFVLP